MQNKSQTIPFKQFNLKKMKKLNLIIVTFLCTLCFGFNNQTFGCVSTITPTGPTTFCSGTNLLTLTSSNAASYKWYNNGVLIVGAASKVYKPLVPETIM